MREVAGTAAAWHNAGRRIAVAMVVAVEGSAPRPVGSAMVVDGAGVTAGSVSAGCVEAAVVDLALGVLRDAAPVVGEFGITDDRALSVGLTCGGRITVAVFAPTHPDIQALERCATAMDHGAPIVLATVVGGGPDTATLVAVDGTGMAGTTGDAERDEVVARVATDLLASDGDDARTVRTAGAAVLLQAFAPPRRLLIFGASDFAAALAAQAVLLGYRVTVCDARAALVAPERFPAEVELVVQWPHRYLHQTAADRRTMICVLTHDEKFDVPLLEAALATPCGYIGVLGSRRAQDQLSTALRARGVDPAELARIHGPIGLDLGARTPAETAVSIAAELIASRTGRAGVPLRSIEGPIHAAATA